ncbi:MAG: contractile injection system tape measure protein [Saprospiraceae bacterium]
MSVLQRHAIRRVTLRLRLPQTEPVAPVQQAVNQMFREEVLPEVSRLFDELISPDQVLRLPKLEVDLGVLSPDISPAQWRERCCQVLREALQAHLTEQISGGKTEELFVPLEQRAWDSWLYFLKTGRLPWWASAPDQEKWEFELLTILQAAVPGQTETLKRQLQADTRQIERLFRQFSPAFLQMLLRTLWPACANTVEAIRAMSSRSVDASPAALRILLRRLFALALLQAPDLAIQRYLAARTLLAESGDTPTVEALLEAYEILYPDIVGGQTAASADPGPTIDQKDSRHPVKVEQKAPEEDGWHVENAGLVILAPFINPLFRGLGLLDENGSLSMPMRQKGIALLRYLTNGDENAPEYQLSLEKLLCGLPADWPIDREVSLTEKEKNETGQLLNAVIQHWAALGHCTISGLQETFLQRKGRLSRRPDGQWLLQPERKTVDILLDRLPWGIGMVQLPWMKGWLLVEW